MQLNVEIPNDFLISRLTKEQKDYDQVIQSVSDRVAVLEKHYGDLTNFGERFKMAQEKTMAVPEAIKEVIQHYNKANANSNNTKILKWIAGILFATVCLTGRDVLGYILKLIATHFH